ncbi:MAG: hypothetical protein AB7K09_09390 [Planctomycetota bacterium]
MATWHRHRPFDRVLSGVILAGNSGTQVAERLRELQSDLPACFKPGHAGRILERQSIGVRDVFLSKPVSNDQLREVLVSTPQSRSSSPEGRAQLAGPMSA